MRTFFRLVAILSLFVCGVNAAAPRTGDRLPDVTAFDEAGKEFPLREKLNGKPAVIVFGCLT